MSVELPDSPPLPATPKRGFHMGRLFGPAGFPATAVSLRQLLGAPRGGLVGAADFSSYVDRVRDQLQTEQCVGMALARIAHVRAQVEKFGSANPGAVPYPSSQGIYQLALEEETTSADEPLVDQGSIPGVAVRALSRDVGVPLERDLPIDVATITKRVSPDVLSKALTMKVAQVASIDSEGTAKLDDVCAALDVGRPPAIGIAVGDNYETCSSDAPVMAETGKIYGGHEIPLLGYRSVAGRRQFLSVGSWGAGWGFGGWCWLDQSVVLDARTQEAWTLVVVPDFSLSEAMRARLARKDS